MLAFIVSIVALSATAGERIKSAQGQASAAGSAAGTSAKASERIDSNSIDSVIAALLLERQMEKEKSRSPAWQSPTVAISIASAAVAVASLAFSFFQLSKNREDNRFWKNRDARSLQYYKLIEALLWFDDSKHHRSVALALVEGHWDQYPELRGTWRSTVCSQAVSIVTQNAVELCDEDDRDLQRAISIVYKPEVPEGKASANESMAALKVAVDDLSTKVVFDASGKPVLPQARTRFIESVQRIFAHHPARPGQSNWPGSADTS